ncbi:MAG TPA: hypothetical protein VK184_10970 [Nostocaceae cyanobacterium]|nr:hypothetical protein [Nostocaceae cyanobacterium]
MAQYSIFQQTFALAMFSLGVENIPGTASELEEKLTQSIKDRFSKHIDLIGNWEIAWGPSVFQVPDSTFADHVMYVAVNDANTYVVAIAGTNPKSDYDWHLDLNVKETVSWHPSTDPNDPDLKISKGTHDGVSNLLNMKDGAGQTLVDFFKQIPNPSAATIIFTGHSLGGALSPTLALKLMNPYNEFGLNKSAWKAVYSYPIAGPTPGDNNFANFFSEVFPITPVGTEVWETWNALIWNNIDMVPNAWYLETMAKITTLYSSAGINPDEQMKGLIYYLISLSEESGVIYTQLQYQHYLSGTVNTGTDFLKFDDQASYQHVLAYYDLLNVPEIKPEPTPELIENQKSKIFGNKLRETQAK